MAVVERPAAAPANIPGRRRTGDSTWQVVGLAGVLVLTVLLRFPLLTKIPVGLHYDEAWSGIDAASVSWRHHPVFFTDSNGMEPLYLYLQAVSIFLFGRTAFALRLVSAVVGTVTIPALYILIRRLAGWRPALFAAGVLAVTYWHVHVSRLGYRAIALPPLECLAWWALWQGVDRRDWRRLSLGGAFVGLALYTYSTARVFPLAVTLWFVWLALRRRDWRYLAGLFVVGLAALIVFAPLAWYFLLHPEEFINRVGQVVVLAPGITAASQPAVVDGVLRTLGMFTFQGDPQWKYNLSGKPIFDPLMSVFFYTGVVLGVVTAWGKTRAVSPSRALVPAPSAAPLLSRDGAALLAIWFLVMLAPGFVTMNPPESLHTLAAVPVVCAFTAMGAMLLWGWLRRHWPAGHRAGPPLAVGLILVEAVATAVSYFLVWAPNPQTYYWLHGDVADLAGVLRRAPASTTLYVATEYYRHPTLRYLASEAAARAIWFDASRSLPVQPTGGPALYAFAHGYQPLSAAAGALPEADLRAAPRDSAGAVKYRVYERTGPAALPALQSASDIVLGGDVRLVGSELSSPGPGAPNVVRITLRWQVLRQPARPLSLFVHLLDASGYRWAQSDGQGFFSKDWRTGDEVITTEEVHLPLGVPALPLTVSADFYDVATGKPLPLAQASPAVRAPDGGVVLGQVTPQPSLPAPGQAVPGARTPVALAPGLRLLGAVLPTVPVPAGGRTTVVLYLQRTAPGPLSDPVVTLEGGAPALEPLPSAGALGALPVGGVIAIRHDVTVPVRTTATRGTVLVRSSTGATPSLGTFEVTPLPRTFTPPQLQHPLDVSFGSVASLIGYDLAVPSGGKTITVTLYWKALAPTDTAFTVFTHLLSPNGALAGQHDGQPAAGAWPTTAWLPNQIIADTHVLPVDDARALSGGVLEVGLYNAAATGLPRLPVTGDPATARGTYAVLTLGG